MIRNIKDLCPELNFKVLGNAPDVVVFEHREIQVLNSGSGNDITSRIAPKIETPQISGILGIRAAESRIAAKRWRRIKEGEGRRRRDGKAPGLDVGRST